MTTTTFKSRPLRSVGGRAVQIPFDFVPEFKPQELLVEFSLLVNDEQTGKKHRLHAYRGTVQVIEPPKNWFDLQLLSVYAISIAAVVGLVYFLYTSYVISEEKSAGTKKFEKPAVVKQSGVQDEWIVSTLLKLADAATSVTRNKMTDSVAFSTLYDASLASLSTTSDPERARASRRALSAAVTTSPRRPAARARAASNQHQSSSDLKLTSGPTIWLEPCLWQPLRRPRAGLGAKARRS